MSSVAKLLPIGLLIVINGIVRSTGHSSDGARTTAVGLAVASYIGGAYYFTSSTSFANPAVTVARSMSDTFAGIQPSSIAGFTFRPSAGLFNAPTRSLSVSNSAMLPFPW